MPRLETKAQSFEKTHKRQNYKLKNFCTDRKFETPFFLKIEFVSAKHRDAPVRETYRIPHLYPYLYRITILIHTNGFLMKVVAPVLFEVCRCIKHEQKAEFRTCK